MTSYVSIPNGDIDQDSPITQPLMTALRDNPIAITEGATGAPRLWLPAIERLEAGTSIRSRRDATVSNTATTPTLLHAFAFMQHGAIRVSAEITTGGGGASLTVSRTRNGTNTTLLSATTNAVHTVDVSVIPGDSVSVAIVSNGITAITARNVRFQTNGQDLWPASPAILEGNRSAT